MWESGEPMEFGIFDFHKVFSRTFGVGVMGQRGLRMESGGSCQRPWISLELKSGAS